MKIKKISLFIATVLGVSLLAGCGADSSLNSNTNSSSVVKSDNSKQDSNNKQESVKTNSKAQYTVDEIRQKINDTSVYDETYINEIAKTVNQVNSASTQNSVSYVYITDTHLGKEDDEPETVYRELNAAVDVANNSDVDFLCLGGDIEDGRFAEDRGGKQTALDILQNVSDILKKCNKPVFILKGNHDDNSFSAQIDEDLLYNPDYIINSTEWYNATMANFKEYATDYHDGYYYYDLEGKNTRVICLNMSNSSDEIVNGQRVEMGMYYYGYKDEQIDWLINKAMSREDCQYIILCHDAFDYPEGYGVDSNRDVLADIIKSAYTHTNFATNKFSKDFTSWTGNILIFNNGHMHMEKFQTPLNIGGVPILTTETAAIYNYGPIDKLPAPWNTFTRTENRTVGSSSEAAFDVVVCTGVSNNGTSDNISVIKFGDGQDMDYQIK